MKNTSCKLTEYKFSGAVLLTNTTCSLPLETSACHIFSQARLLSLVVIVMHTLMEAEFKNLPFLLAAEIAASLKVLIVSH